MRLPPEKICKTVGPLSGRKRRRIEMLPAAVMHNVTVT